MGQSSLPIWVLCTIEFIWVKGNPLNCHDKMISSQNHFFRDPFFTPKRSPGQNVDPGLKNPIPGSKIRPRAWKNKRCALKNHAEPRSQNCKRSHIVQVMANNHSEGYPPKWFSAITCAIWLRLIFRGRGSAWFFGAHLLFFHARGRILEAGVGFWNPEVDILARGRFLSDFGVPKKIVLQRKYFLVRIQGDPSCPNELYGPWEPYGQATLSQNPFKK